jgi:hypothetical protein
MHAARLRALVIVTLALGTLASTCQQCQAIGDPRRGNVDRVSDVVLVAAADGHSYAVSANPELQHLRILDLTDGRFVTAPNRFFPLSVPSGTETRRLAVAVDVRTQAPDPTRVYALDSADDVIRIVRVTNEDDAAVFDVVGTISTGRGPGDIAALRLDDTTVLVAVTHEETGEVAIQRLENDVATDAVDVALPTRDDGPWAGVPSVPAAIEADPLGRAFVVADAGLPHVVAIEVAATEGSLATSTRVVDVVGPVHTLAAGVVDVGDGLAPVVVAVRADVAALMLVRLYRPGFAQDRYALLGGTALPAPGATAYVPDARATDAEVTVCCNGLSSGQIAAGEATASFAAVTLVDGRVLYVQLAAATLDGLALPTGRRIVRLVDDDPAPLGPPLGLDVNTDPSLWVPVDGGQDRRPTVRFETFDDLGAPPFVPLPALGASLLLAWESALPTVRDVAGVLAPGPRTYTAVVDLAARGARRLDVARLTPSTTRVGCAASFDARILETDGATLTLAFVNDGSGQTPALDDDDVTSCLTGAGDVTVSVIVADAFVVTEGPRFLGRLAMVEGGEHPVSDRRLALGGVVLTVASAAAGSPLPESKLALPLDARVTTLGLDLPSDGVGSVALVPTSMTGGTIVMPDAQTPTARISARRMVMSTAGVSSSSLSGAGLPGLLTCDEAETTVRFVEIFN